MAEGVCQQCHIHSLTEERFALADRVKQEARSVLAEAEKVIRDLEAGGILPKRIDSGTRAALSGYLANRGLYYRMFQFHNVYTWKGAYHFSADFAHWYGWAHLQMSLIEIKEEQESLENGKK